MFINESVNLKCSYPKDYNDPYELFLSIDPQGVKPEYIAYYHEILSEIPQWPTTCFSLCPNVVPMWAHYASEHSGFVIEVDEEKLQGQYLESTIQDMTYSDNTGTIDMELIRYACVTAKYRHTYRVINMAFNNAYFTKNECWKYEQERRVVLSGETRLQVDDNMLMQIPYDSISSIILGPQASSDLIARVKTLSKRVGCNFYRMIIGKASCIPYFIDEEQVSYVFNGYEILPAQVTCLECSEPIDESNSLKQCHWCSVNESLKYNASARNPLRMLSNAGLLDDYIRTYGR